MFKPIKIRPEHTLGHSKAFKLAKEVSSHFANFLVSTCSLFEATAGSFPLPLGETIIVTAQAARMR